MRPTKSTMMLQLGSQAPEFSLPDAQGLLVSRSDFVGKPLLVAFLGNVCPYVAAIVEDLVLLKKDYGPQGLAVVAINANATGKNDDESSEMMVRMAQIWGFDFAYLVDETQKVAQSYRAACTPDFYLFDSNHKLVYRGQIDGPRGCAAAHATATLTDAVQAVLHKKPLAEIQNPSIGCSIEWLHGQAPAYAIDDAAAYSERS